MSMHSDLPNTAFGVMRLLPDTKTEVDTFSKQLINAVTNGEINPLELKAMFKFMEAVFEKVNEATKENQLREAAKYSEKKFNAYGYDIEKSEVGVKYDYSKCGDTIYEERQAAFDAAKNLLDERAAFLRAMKEPTTMVDNMTGEVVTVNPPTRKGSEGLKFSMK